jgi:hypothetical protein
LNNSASALLTQVGQHRPDQLNRASEVGCDLMSDLRVRQFLGRSDQAVSRVADNHIDLTQAPERLVDRRPNVIRVREFEPHHAEVFLMRLLEISERILTPHRRYDAIAAVQKSPRHDPSEARGRSSDEPSLVHAMISNVDN